MKEFDDLVEEAFSNVSVMDVSELRTLYYGRLNMYASFGDNGNHMLEGIQGGTLVRPYGVESFSMDAIIGRKVSSPYFYANVFRLTSTNVLSATSYSRDSYLSDVDGLYALSYLKDDVIAAMVGVIDANGRLRSYFERIWELTRAIAEEGRESDVLWSRILVDLGYDAVQDIRGSRIIIPTRQPVTLVLNLDKVFDLDIVPIQKYRRDRRMNVIRRINKKNTLLWQRRNRIAKRRTTKYREDDLKADSVAAFRNLVLFGLGV